jgi:hypothetical protein
MAKSERTPNGADCAPTALAVTVAYVDDLMAFPDLVNAQFAETLARIVQVVWGLQEAGETADLDFFLADLRTVASDWR